MIHSLGGRDADDRLGEIIRLESNGIKQGATGRAIRAVNQDGGEPAQRILFHWAGSVAEFALPRDDLNVAPSNQSDV